MATSKQKAAARKNIKKAAKAAKRGKTISKLPKKTRTALPSADDSFNNPASSAASSGAEAVAHRLEWSRMLGWRSGQVASTACL